MRPVSEKNGKEEEEFYQYVHISKVLQQINFHYKGPLCAAVASSVNNETDKIDHKLIKVKFINALLIDIEKSLCRLQKK